MFVRHPFKLVDCERRDSVETELFIVEGDSAAGAVASIRAVQTQAVLPMQGKPLNAWRASAARVMAHELFLALSAALAVPMQDAQAARPERSVSGRSVPGVDAAEAGAEAGAEADTPASRLARMRYGKVLLLFDPDADGIHCAALMTMFFHRWMRDLLDSGRIEIVRAPLFRITCRPGEGGPQQAGYAYSHEHCAALCKMLRGRGAIEVDAHYYRGLGSLNSAVLAETCVVPQTRSSRVLERADALAAIEAFVPAPPAGKRG